MTDSLRRICSQLPETTWVLVEERAEETVCCADVEFAPGDWPKDAEPLRTVAIRFRKRQTSLLEGEVTKTLAIVSNRRELSAPELCRWHWQKAGTTCSFMTKTGVKRDSLEQLKGQYDRARGLLTAAPYR